MPTQIGWRGLMRRPHDINKAYSLLVNREIARLMLEDPRLLAEARRGLAEMTAPHQGAAVRTWSELLAKPPEVIAASLCRDDEEGDYIRETRPPFVALDTRTRMRLLEEARHLMTTYP